LALRRSRSGAVVAGSLLRAGGRGLGTSLTTVNNGIYSTLWCWQYCSWLFGLGGPPGPPSM